MLRASVTDNFTQVTSCFEGHCLFPYLDVKGLVTIGYGNLIETTDKDGGPCPAIPGILDWRDMSGLPVEHNRVVALWWKVKGMQEKAPLGGGVFRWYTDLRVTEESLNQLMTATLTSFYQTVKGTYLPDLDVWPSCAQLALMSLVWACGPHFLRTWPHLYEGAKAQNWDVCAGNCHMSEVGNPGLHPRNTMNWKLFTEAAKNGDPEALPSWVLA